MLAYTVYVGVNCLVIILLATIIYLDWLDYFKEA